MSTLVVKNLPDDLHDRMRERASRNRRSVAQEAIHILEAGIDTAPKRMPIELPPLVKLKGGPLTTEQILAAIREGRA